MSFVSTFFATLTEAGVEALAQARSLWFNKGIVEWKNKAKGEESIRSAAWELLRRSASHSLR